MEELSVKKKRLRRIALLMGNAVLVCVILLLCVWRVNSNHSDGMESAKNAFVSNVSSMRSFANEVLSSEQSACRDWAVYINGADMTMEEALEYLSRANSDDAVMAHILDYDTCSGYSSKAREDGDSAVDYSSFSDALASAQSAMNREKDGDVCITSAYTNPISHYQSVGFLENITLTEDGGQKDYMLIRVVPSDKIAEKWVFPHQYAEGELAMISEDGEYIIRASAFKNQNLWEFVRIYNELGYDEAEAVKEEFYSGKTQIMQLKDSKGQAYCLVCLPIEDIRTDAWYAAYIPTGFLETTRVDYTMVAIVAIGMLMILLFNSLYILDMNLKLRKSNTLAVNASRAKTDFLSSMSHDIRTPMNAIVGLTDIASRNVDDPIRVSDCLTKITAASNHLLTLINDILDISKIESGKLSLNAAAFSLRKMVDGEINIVQQQLKNKEMELEVNTDGIQEEYLIADELRLNQIFINLLSNAVKYTQPGGKIRVDVSSVLTGEDGNKARLIYKVADSGIGMTEEFMKTMYEPFTRVADSRKDQTQGTGLGLSITKKIIDLMEGDITCESEIGKGSVFTVTLMLPIADQTQAAKNTSAETGFELKGLHLLVAEDNDINWEIIHELLAVHDISAVRAVNGRAAVDMLENEEAGTFDAILMDIQMPVMNGREATVEIRKLPDETKRMIPVIAMTADAFAEDIQACLEAGMDAHVAKPVDMNKLLSALREALAART